MQQNLTLRAKVTPHPLLSRFCQRTRVPTVSNRDQELFSVLSKTVPQAITALVPKTLLIHLYQILPTLGRKSGSSPVKPPLLKLQLALKSIELLAILVMFARRTSLATAA